MFMRRDGLMAFDLQGKQEDKCANRVIPIFLQMFTKGSDKWNPLRLSVKDIVMRVC
jgi:hypothetical protein